jgi:hypothetical protein
MSAQHTDVLERHPSARHQPRKLPLNLAKILPTYRERRRQQMAYHSNYDFDAALGHHET